MIAAMGQRMVDVANESIQIAGHSKNIETRRSRARVAREKMRQLRELAEEYPLIRIERLADVERDLAMIDLETDKLEVTCSSETPSGWTIGNPDARHPYAFGGGHPAARMFDCLEFHATFQLRTPKRILERHNTTIPLTETPPSDFEPWMGVWFPIMTGPKILAELAPDAWAEFEANRTVASDAGSVKPADYLPFLMAFRTIVEDEAASIAERIERIDALFLKPEWSGYAAALQGSERVCGWFFPSVLSLIGGLPSASRSALNGKGLRTVAELRSADDATLQAIKGIGRAKVAAIRQFCDAFDGNPQAERLVDVAL